MGYPLDNGSDGYHSYTFYQGVIAAQLLTALALFFLVQWLHYWIWGHQQQAWEYKKNEQGDASVLPLPPSEWKWQQRTFNMYFGVIFGSHCSALFLPLMYYPSIFTCVVSYLHLACFIGMLINSICMGEEQPGQGGRTITNRVLWIIMCLANLALIIAGLSGVQSVLS